MEIHFVCTGNTYRSRMAEAYVRSKAKQAIEVSSSGTHADDNKNGPISWVSAYVLKKRSLITHASPHWTQTTKELLDSVDLVIFMEEFHYDHSAKNFGYAKKNFEIWNVKDVESGMDDVEKMQVGLETFTQIAAKADDLLSRLT